MDTLSKMFLVMLMLLAGIATLYGVVFLGFELWHHIFPALEAVRP